MGKSCWEERIQGPRHPRTVDAAGRPIEEQKETPAPTPAKRPYRITRKEMESGQFGALEDIGSGVCKVVDE